MTPGPNLILRLPNSTTLTQITSLDSSNNFGATYWTDGRCVAPMEPDELWLRVHRPTGEFFWTDECEEIGQDTAWGGISSEWKDIPFADDPDADDFLHAIQNGLADNPKKIRYLRVWLWWKQNDSVRSDGQLQADLEAYRGNLEALIAISDLTHPNERLMAAEVARQLGDFARACELLAGELPVDYAHAATRIRDLAEQRDTLVRQL